MESQDAGSTMVDGTLHDVLSDEKSRTDNALLAIDGLTIGYGTRRVLADLQLRIPGRGVTVLMGPGGAGKSTLLYWLSGLPASGRRFHEGRVRYAGRAIEEAGQRPALVRQKAQLLSGRLLDVLSTSLRPRMQATPAQLRVASIERLHQLGLASLEAALDSIVANLPTADIRLAAVLQAAFTDAPLLLIDEPTHGLVEADSDRVLALIERMAADRACLVTTHNQRHARRLANHAVLLAGGRIQIDATAAEFFANSDGHPVLAQFLRTGSCSVPGLDAQPDQLADDIAATVAAPAVVRSAPPSDMAAQAPAPPAPAVATTAVPAPESTAAGTPAPAGGTDMLDDEPSLLTPGASEFSPILSAPPSSQGPTGFRWLIRGRIAGCAMPGVVASMDHDLALLKRMGVTLLINLTEREFPAEPLARHGLKGFAVRIEDRRAPPLLWAKLLLAKMNGFLRDGETIAVHCLAGLGRTGTVLCGWLIREGLTASEALRRLRTIDPGFVQSEEQEQLLVELENNLLIRSR